MKKMIVTGKGTFELRETLKSFGGTWDGARKGWVFSPEAYAAASACLDRASYSGRKHRVWMTMCNHDEFEG